MIKLNYSLRGSLILAFTTIALILVMGYSFLSVQYFLKGMDTIIADNLLRVATAVANDKGYIDVNDLDSYTITREWTEQPNSIIAAVPSPPKNDNQLHKVKLQTTEQQSQQLIFYMSAATSKGPFYVSFQTSSDRVSDLALRNARDSLVTLLVIGLGSGIVVALIVWWLIHRIAQPVTRLGIWARGLNEQTLDENVPDFGFRDLNDFAQVVRNSLISVKEGLDREQTFLRQASHELRTPISIIRSNIQLLDKLKSVQPNVQRDSRENAAVERIDRASLTMKHMTETLLWLGREDCNELSQSKVQLDRFIENIISDLKYLLDGKSVQLSVHTEPCSCELPETAARIILGNLVRNAFQHTWEGRVQIIQENGKIEINNFQASETEANEDLGFGLGLQLTEKLTQRLGWRFDNIVRRDGRSVRLCFKANLELTETDLNF
ncbi:HAMP domain-containing histidine kinase [Shewanella profunda]|uniref:sensor histidine kinase n=1 Tax=Shewanella profunda TaxID=254793 RepID=UPI0020108C0B|nr:HAMP domain-containing sensor histidine kinase [Shewanella profunda]MCL1090183.1 HAMP domain-containing histidine kinase [Shewanella profunda]